MPLSPIISSCLLSLGIGCASNLIAQRLKAYNAGTPFVFDAGLFWRFAIVSVVTTPVNYWWQLWLERTFPGWKIAAAADASTTLLVLHDGEEKGFALASSSSQDDHRKEKKHLGPPPPPPSARRVRNWPNIFCKWFADCMTLGALLNTAMFLVLMGWMEGKTGPQIREHLRVDMARIIWDSYKIWPVANLVSTMYCPVEKRIVFLSCCGLVWNVYLALVAAEL